MADVSAEDLHLPGDVLAKLAELDLELSEGWLTFTQKDLRSVVDSYYLFSVDSGYLVID